MPTEKKRAVVAQLAEELARSQVVILSRYQGLKMKDLTTVRRGLQRSGGAFLVVKNSLLRLALQEAQIDGLDSYLDGPTAVALAYEDPVATAKALSEQGVAFSAIRVKGAWMEGRALPPEAFQELASLPPRPILLGQVVGMLQAPMTQLAGGLASAMRQLLYVLQARSEQGSTEAA